jgi:serine/threonine protein phosphatase PrpC
MIACSQCGNENREEASFCRYCGQVLGEPAPSEIETSLVSSAPPEPDAEEERILQKGDASEEPMAGAEEDKSGELPHLKTAIDAEPPAPVQDIEEVHVPQLPLLAKDEGGDTTPSVPIESTAASTTLDQRLSGADFVEGSPMSKGDLLQNRYRVVEILSQDDAPTVYEVEDILLCWNCAYVQASLDETFCENCGAAMDQKVRVRIREVVLSSETPEMVEGVFEEGGRLYQVETQDELPESDQTPAIQFAVGYQSDAGELREVDEDSVLILHLAALCEMGNAPLLGLFAVADGIGGHDAGEIASQAVVHSLAASVMEHIFTPEVAENALSLEELKTRFKEAVLVANQAVLDIRAETEADLGSTLTAVLVRDTQAIIVNIGDSRTYLMRAGNLSQITEDHSMVAKMVAQNIIQPEEIYTHEQKGVIYRSLGDKSELTIDDSIFELTLDVGDRLFLCCDGLWEMVNDNLIEDTLLEYYDPQAACDRLIEMANLAGGEDNISVIVVNVQALKYFR